MILVPDASAAAKLVIRESGTDIVHQLWDEPVTWLAPTIIVPEVVSAIVAAGRAGRLRGPAERAHRQWQIAVGDIELRVVDADMAAYAGTVAKTHVVRGADAVYVALARALGQHTDVLLASFDQRQRGAALEAGVAVVPADL